MVSFLRCGGLSVLRLGVSHSFVCGLVSLTFGLLSQVWGLVFLRLGVNQSHVWGLVSLTFAG